MPWKVEQGDCVELMARMDTASVEAIVTDPPYGLGFMGKEWDDLPPGPAFAGEALRVLRPGGHVLAFGGTRTFHRLAVALEDEGFAIRDTIMWLYAQGFPKSKDAGDGWGTALKPAHEPIIVARKPLDGTVAENVLRHGTGALNIGATKIPFADAADLAEALAKNPGRDGEKVTSDVYGADRPQQVVDEAGRWPANLVLDEGAGQMLDSQSGERPGGGYPEQRGANAVYSPTSGGSDGPRSMGDTGGASRFFFCPKVGRLERDLGLIDFDAKALLWSSGEQSPGTFQSDGTDRSARNPHPTVKPIELMRWLCRLVTPLGGTVLDPFSGSGSTGIAAILEGYDFIGMEKEQEYVEIAEARIARWEPYVGIETEGALRSAAREEIAKEAGQIGLL